MIKFDNLFSNFIFKTIKKTYIYKGDDPFSSHNRIAKIITNSGKNTVLDIGCNTGFIGKALFKRGWKGDITGIDIEKSFRSKALSIGYKDFYTIDLTSDFYNLEKKYDVIVFGDVLEHIFKPLPVLKKLLSHLKPDGIVVVSLPNVANIYIRLNLLFGNFTYTNRGILDQDHKVFYTLKTARKMLEMGKLTIKNVEVTPIPLPIISELFFPNKILFLPYFAFYQISRIFKTLFGYQLLFTCSSKS